MIEFLQKRKERLTREYRDDPKITTWARIQECKYILRYLTHDITGSKKAAGTAKGGAGASQSPADNTSPATHR